MNVLPSHNVVRDKVFSFFCRHLPNKTKRIVFMASLSARIHGSTEVDDETLEKINKAMVIASSHSALKLPMLLSRAIWHGRESHEIFNDRLENGYYNQLRITRAVECVLKLMPSWLRYAADEEISRDITSLIDNRELVTGMK